MKKSPDISLSGINIEAWSLSMRSALTDGQLMFDLFVFLSPKLLSLHFFKCITAQPMALFLIARRSVVTLGVLLPYIPIIALRDNLAGNCNKERRRLIIPQIAVGTRICFFLFLRRKLAYYFSTGPQEPDPLQCELLCKLVKQIQHICFYLQQTFRNVCL